MYTDTTLPTGVPCKIKKKTLSVVIINFSHSSSEAEKEEEDKEEDLRCDLILELRLE